MFQKHPMSDKINKGLQSIPYSGVASRSRKGQTRSCLTTAQKTSDVLQTSDVWENQQSFTINPLFSSGLQKQKRANKELFNHCTDYYIFFSRCCPQKVISCFLQ
jgi:hypothetical protein